MPRPSARPLVHGHRRLQVLNFHDFLLGEVRYLSVKKAYPNEAEELFAEAQKMAQLRYKSYVRKTQENWED